MLNPKANPSAEMTAEMQLERTRHEKLSVELMARHEVLLDLIGCAPFHYVDIPTHGNVGDLLIMHGTLAFFRKHDLVPKLIAPYFAYDPCWIAPEDVIVFHGGGNFGDLYPYFQELRERIVQNHRENRIIVLPQSLHFSSIEKMKQSAQLFRMHADVHICVRDQVSYQMAQEFTDNVYLLPDMAHQLYPMRVAGAEPSAGSLRISRVDDESTQQSGLRNMVSTTVTDWPEFVGAREVRINLFRRAIGAFYRRGLGWSANSILVRLWIAYSGRLIADAAQLFARHELIVTDRLHGHILACLLRKKNIVLDNSYGKNSRYVEAWTLNSELVMLQKSNAAIAAANTRFGLNAAAI
ncbi:polysaccharide pyruvyl transferase family protein [Herminiimonas fonticola]|uniref:Pyruvyl transferase EpsO n=1 Tax=Herminiimonas fonticola TaxID=303380 RepID=A0A4R6G4X1_9BURK|nr:polysaccharide pyruvyl transferase family protein [Herminiimonas fonticola]RBA23007.1 Exopolysaccharide biosynthesis protein [Herminiimonas fonticola]TDN89551.1 pyruvyl transferase EpsO [Herminiimonas fonticola]